MSDREMSPREKALQEQYEADEAKRRQYEESRRIGGDDDARRRYKQLQSDLAAAKKLDEADAAKVEALRVANIASLDSKYKAHELSIWRLSGRSDAEFEKWWPARRGELARTEVDKHVAAVTNNFYKDF